MKKLSLLLILSLALIGCGSGPGADALRDQVQQRLNENFEQGLLEVVDFHRRGSQPYTSESEGASGVVVYYKAQLKFLKDYKLTDWDSNNVASLMTVLGAGFSGITGVNPDGNSSGDELEVFGLQAFVEKGDGWVSVPFGSEDTGTQGLGQEGKYVSEIDAVEEKYFGMGAPWYRSYIQNLQKTASKLRRAGSHQAEASLRADLTVALTKAQLKEAKVDQRVSFLSGSPGRDYYALGRGLEGVTRPSSLESLMVFPSDGSISNLSLVKDELATFAIAQSDIAAMSYHGTAIFTGQRNDRLRAIGALYPEAVQIFVRRDAGITSISDLAGKRVNIGLLGSGGRANAEQVLQAHGVNLDGFYGQSMGTAVMSLQEGKLDAIIFTGAYPSRVIQGLTADVDILALDKAAIGELVEFHGIIPITIPANTYRGIEHPVSTVGVTALLVTNHDTEEGRVRAMMEIVYGSVEQLSKVSVQASLINPGKARQGVSIPLHPAAEKYFTQR